MDTRCWFIIFILSQFHSLYRRKFFANGDSFASIAQMKQIVDLEMRLGQSLERFVELEKSRLEKVKQFSKSVKEAMNQVQLEGPKSLENPATSYAVIKRFANGWTELGNFFREGLFQRFTTSTKVKQMAVSNSQGRSSGCHGGYVSAPRYL